MQAGERLVGREPALRAGAAQNGLAQGNLRGRAVCQFELEVIRVAACEYRQRLDALHLAAGELSDENAVGLQCRGEMFRHRAEEIVSDRGRNLTGDLQNVSLFGFGSRPPAIRLSRGPLVTENELVVPKLIEVAGANLA